MTKVILLYFFAIYYFKKMDFFALSPHSSLSEPPDGSLFLLAWPVRCSRATGLQRVWLGSLDRGLADDAPVDAVACV